MMKINTIRLTKNTGHISSEMYLKSVDLTGKCLFKAIGDKAMGCIIGGYAYLYPVSLYNLDPVFFHAAGKDACDNDVIIALNLHGPPAHNPGHQAFQLNQISSTQGAPFLITG